MLLSVLPSIRLFLPPPCSLLAAREWVSLGKYSCKSVQRGRRARGHKPLCARPGSWSAGCSRQQTLGGRGRRFATLWWRGFLVAAAQGGGQLQGRAANKDGRALKRARRMKETTNPEFVQPGSRTRLVGLVLEVGSRWSQEAPTFVQIAGSGPHMIGAISDATAHQAGVASSLVLDPLVCCNDCIIVGIPRRSRCRRTHFSWP